MMSTGAMVPKDLMLGLMEDHMNSHKANIFLIDGFPRT